MVLKQMNVANNQQSPNEPRTKGASRAVRLGNHDYASDHPVHLIVGTDGGEKILVGDVAHLVAESVVKTTSMLGFELIAYCVMPDHLHVLLTPADSEVGIDEWLRRMKSFTTRQVQQATGQSRLWQRSAYDRVIRYNESVSGVAAYVVNNPVRAGLVEDWRDWEYCWLCDGI
jgi:REP element-mobilizing transposase RayT